MESPDTDSEQAMMAGWVMLNTVVVVLSCIKMITYLKVYPSFAKMCEFVRQVVKDIMLFALVYMAMWVTFSILFEISGLDYQGMAPDLTFMQV